MVCIFLYAFFPDNDIYGKYGGLLVVKFVIKEQMLIFFFTFSSEIIWNIMTYLFYQAHSFVHVLMLFFNTIFFCIFSGRQEFWLSVGNNDYDQKYLRSLWGVFFSNFFQIFRFYLNELLLSVDLGRFYRFLSITYIS